MKSAIVDIYDTFGVIGQAKSQANVSAFLQNGKIFSLGHVLFPLKTKRVEMGHKRLQTFLF